MFFFVVVVVGGGGGGGGVFFLHLTCSYKTKDTIIAKVNIRIFKVCLAL